MTLDQEQAAKTEDALTDRLILTGRLFRRRGSCATLKEIPPPPHPKLVRPPAKVARMVDLMLLVPNLQLAVLELEAVDVAEPISERAYERWRTPGTRWSSGLDSHFCGRLAGSAVIGSVAHDSRGGRTCVVTHIDQHQAIAPHLTRARRH